MNCTWVPGYQSLSTPQRQSSRLIHKSESTRRRQSHWHSCCLWSNCSQSNEPSSCCARSSSTITRRLQTSWGKVKQPVASHSAGQRNIWLTIGHAVQASADTQKQLLTGFLQAIQAGEMSSLMNLLAEDVTFWGDGGGKVKGAATRPISGRIGSGTLLSANRKRVQTLITGRCSGGAGRSQSSTCA